MCSIIGATIKNTKGKNMKILIMSRNDIEKMAEQAFPEGTAVISITDYGDEPVFFQNAPAFIHHVSFDDVDNDVIIDELGTHGTKEEKRKIEEKHHMCSNGQALEIAEFYDFIRDKADVLICQCEHGQSRSAAVAAAILEHRGKKGIRIFADDRYYPNKVVFRRVLEAIRILYKVEE
jgi:predicted protein tyrosine phosphatase